jgi:hypothetical protein
LAIPMVLRIDQLSSKKTGSGAMLSGSAALREREARLCYYLGVCWSASVCGAGELELMGQ